jgi:hypothetical protein
MECGQGCHNNIVAVNWCLFGEIANVFVGFGKVEVELNARFTRGAVAPRIAVVIT